MAHPDPVVDQGLTWPSGRPRPPGEWSPGPNAPADRIDFIYTAGAIETLGSDVVGESGGPDVTIAVDPWGTDHRAIVSELSVEGGVLPTLVSVGSRLIESGTDQTLTFHGPGGPDQHVVVFRERDPSYPLADELVPGSHRRHGEHRDRWLGGRARTSCSSRREPRCFRACASGSRRWATIRTCRLQRGSTGSAIRSHVRWWNAPGNRWDWVGVYERGADPNVASYLTWFYTRSTIRGRGTLDAASSGPWPLPPGRYSIYLLADDGYDILARTGFLVC